MEQQAGESTYVLQHRHGFTADGGGEKIRNHSLQIANLALPLGTHELVHDWLAVHIRLVGRAKRVQKSDGCIRALRRGPCRSDSQQTHQQGDAHRLRGVVHFTPHGLQTSNGMHVITACAQQRVVHISCRGAANLAAVLCAALCTAARIGGTGRCAVFVVWQDEIWLSGQAPAGIGD